MVGEVYKNNRVSASSFTFMLRLLESSSPSVSRCLKIETVVLLIACVIRSLWTLTLPKWYPILELGRSFLYLGHNCLSTFPNGSRMIARCQVLCVGMRWSKPCYKFILAKTFPGQPSLYQVVPRVGLCLTNHPIINVLLMLFLNLYFARPHVIVK